MLQPSKNLVGATQGRTFPCDLPRGNGTPRLPAHRPLRRSKDYSNLPGLDHYQNEMRYLDFFVRNLMDQYKELGLYEDTIFVIYGDHGEGFGSTTSSSTTIPSTRRGSRCPSSSTHLDASRKANASRP